MQKMEGPLEYLLQNSLINDGLVFFEFWIGRRMGDISIKVGLNIAVVLNMCKLLLCVFLCSLYINEYNIISMFNIVNVLFKETHIYLHMYIKCSCYDNIICNVTSMQYNIIIHI